MSAGARGARTVPPARQASGPQWEWAAPPPTAPRPGGGGQAQPDVSAAAREPGRTRMTWSLLPAAALVASSGYAFHRIFAVADLLPVLALGTLAPTVLCLLMSGRLFGRNRAAAPLWPSVLLTAVAWVVVGCATLFRHAGGGLPTPVAMRALWHALLDAPHAVLTTILPVPGDPALLVLPYAVLWAASFAAAELCLRTRAPLLPALPAVAAFGVPLLLGVDGPGSNLPAVAALAGFTGVLVLVRSRVAPSWRGLAVALPAVAVTSVVAAGIGPYLPGMRTPYDPRNAVTPPVVHPTSTSPLDQVAAWMRNGTRPVFTVRTRGGDGQENYRLAVLDRYDGTTWSSAAELARTGGRIPPAAGADPGGRQTVTQTFTVQSLPGLWLPAADRPVRVDVPAGSDLAVDPADGVLSAGGPGAAVGTGSAAGRIRDGFRYTVVSELPVYDVARLQYAPAADDPAMTALPRTDPVGRPIPAVATFAKAASAATAGSTFPYQQAARLADWLRAGYRFDPTALPGHGYRQLEFFLTEGRRGTSEQFAAAFAVMARTLGLPSRVAVGFRPGTDTGDGLRQVRGQDVLAWPEVEFAGIGWVPFYPTPDAASKSGSAVAPAGQPEQRRRIDQQITRAPRTSTPPHRPPGPGHASGHGRGGALPVEVLAPLGLLVAAAGYAGYAAWVPWRRRDRRRGHPDPGQRVLGAWQQIVDRLTEIGLPATGAHTAAEVASFGAARVGGAAGEHLPALARLVNEVGYAGRTPDAASADAAWLHADAVERVVVRSVPRRERVRRALRPASLRRRA